MEINPDNRAFFALVRAGLWEKEARLLPIGSLDFLKIYRLAQEQSVVGLIAAGIEHIDDYKIPQEVVLSIVGDTLKLEQRNRDMNLFLGSLIEKLRKAGIKAVLVKGQGIGQCYERPLWRTCGDIDLILGDTDYINAIKILTPLASRFKEDSVRFKHYAMTIDSWEVELHGSLRDGLLNRIDVVLDEVQNEVLTKCLVRSWIDDKIQVPLPRVDEDVVFVFSHILQHFFNEGIGLRQICDWCRLLWAYRVSLNNELLKSRIKKAGIMSEWKAFGSLAVEYLGMPVEAMPLYSDDKKWSRKADKVMGFILETGNFGHNRDYSYYQKYPYVVFKAISLWRHIKDFGRYFVIFPLDAIKVTWRRMVVGVSVVLQGNKHE